MNKHKWARVLAAILMVVLVVFATPLEGSAQSEIIVDPAAALGATDIVNGTVTAIEYREASYFVFTIATFNIEENLTGTAEGEILVEVLGGTRSDGLQSVSPYHPILEVGAELQLALNRTDPEIEAMLGLAPPVYSLSGASDGAASTNGNPLVGQEEAFGDFAFLGGKWDSMPIRYRVDPARSPISQSQWVGLVQATADVWENDPNSFIDFDYQGLATASTPSNVVGWFELDLFGPNVLGVGLPLYDPVTGAIEEFVLVMDSTPGTFSVAPQADRIHLGSVLLHEFGHILGFAHVNNPTELMFQGIGPGTVVGLGSGARAGAFALYPGSSSGCGGLTVTIDMNLGASGIGSAGNDVILGTPGNDVIRGGGGNDVVCAGAGNDYISMGNGNDVVFGGEGIDRIIGRGGRDTLDGGPDRDIIAGGDGPDYIWGQSGRDSLFGGDGNDEINGGPDTDLIRGDGGNDKLFSGPTGNDRLVGGAGNDVLDATSTSGSTRQIGDAGHDTMYGSKQVDRFWGGDGNDTIRAGDRIDFIRGGPGNDKMYGGDGNDIFDGADGNDQMLGENGNDKMVGLAGTDTCHGGPGIDIAHSTCEIVKQVP